MKTYTRDVIVRTALFFVLGVVISIFISLFRDDMSWEEILHQNWSAFLFVVLIASFWFSLTCYGEEPFWRRIKNRKKTPKETDDRK